MTLWTLADLLLKSSAIFSLAAIAATFARKSPSVKRLIWVAAFVAVPLAVLGSLLVPASLHLVTFQTAAMPLNPFLPPKNSLSFAQLLFVAWVLGFVAVLSCGAGCWRSLMRLRHRSGVVLELNGIDLGALSELAGVRRIWELRVSESSSPLAAMTWGWRRPVVLLPKSSQGWETSRVRAVLLHELAHIRRSDSIAQLFILLVCAGLWFNPLAWLAAKAYRSCAEEAADHAVLDAGVRPTEYASVLLALASELGRARQPDAVVASAILRHAGIEGRIRSVVKARSGRKATKGQSLIAAVIALVAVCGLATFRTAIAVPQAVPDVFKSKTKEWIEGYLSAQEYRSEHGRPPPRTAEEKYAIEKRVREAYETKTP